MAHGRTRTAGRPPRVAFQGEAGAYSDEAAQVLFPRAATVGYPVFSEVFEALGAGAVQRAVLPVENTTAGVVQEVSDLLWAHDDVHVVGEHVSSIRHFLLAPSGAAVRRALSHPQALAQCAQWLREHDVEPVPFYDTAGAAREVACNPREGDAAIASAAASKRYGLRIVASDIADSHTNQTRFLVLSIGEPGPARGAGRRKLILGFTTPHQPGALARVMAVFGRHNANLTRLDSRPIPHQPFTYRFYADAEVDDSCEEDALLGDLKNASVVFRAFGAFDQDPAHANAPRHNEGSS